ncbi:MAG: DUF2484 family protein [Paracoccaceae bacterium]
MTAALAAVIWVLAATGIAFLPIRHQIAPGLVLLAAVPPLLAWIGVSYGWLWLVPAVLAFVSMFRRPLGYLIRRALGRPVLRPSPMEEGE